VKSDLFTNYAMFQLLLNFSDQIVRHNNLYVHGKGRMHHVNVVKSQ